MFNIIKNLKANIQKNNMKILAISMALGMFCYCTNNAAEKPIKIDDVLMTMLEGQMDIKIAIGKILLDTRKKIYSKIKDHEKKVKKKKVSNFIKEQIVSEGKNDAMLQNDMKILEQYFHLEEIKDDNDECNEGNLTEIFWDNVEEEENGEIEVKEGEGIKVYFQTIIDVEKAISKAFQEYYAAIKANHQDKVYEDILKGIMKDCCGAEEISNLETNVIKNLRKLLGEGKENEEAKEFILTKIKKRITLDKNITEKNFISFLKQKIGEEKKEVECCPCCDCF